MIIAFVYDFPHQKSVNGLLNLAINGHRVLCIAAPKKVLTVKQSKTRVTSIIEPEHPRLVAERLGFYYEVMDHDDPIVTDRLWRGDIGVILGARILKKHVTSKIPIINMHPGLLPQNRGLDNLKWAIIMGIQQGVTTHIIDENVDRGILLEKKTIDVYPDDTLLDIHLRLKSKEIQMINNAIELINNKSYGPPLEIGNYHTAMTDDMDKLVHMNFSIYKESYQYL